MNDPDQRSESENDSLRLSNHSPGEAMEPQSSLVDRSLGTSPAAEKMERLEDLDAEEDLDKEMMELADLVRRYKALKEKKLKKEIDRISDQDTGNQNTDGIE